MRLLFLKEMNDLIEKGEFSEKRKAKYEKWIADAERARAPDKPSLDERLNQYDKAEELLTWYTFAPILRMNTEQRIIILNEFLKPLLGLDVVVSRPSLNFEKLLLPPKSYLEAIPVDHPVRYIREEIKSHRNGKIPLEGHTHIDVLIETNELIIPIEAKFTSDIDYQRTYSCIRNQMARTIDVSIEMAKKLQPPKKVLFLLCAPRNLYNKGRYYHYKMKDYEKLENLKHDLPHQAKFFEAYFYSAHAIFWKDVASTIIRNAVVWKLLDNEEFNGLKEFYEERLIELSLK